MKKLCVVCEEEAKIKTTNGYHLCYKLGCHEEFEKGCRKSTETVTRNKWIRPSELPDRFHGSCWVVWKSWTRTSHEKIHEPSLYLVQNYYRGNIPEYWCDEGYYTALKEDEYRLIILDVPVKPTEEDW